MRRCLFDVLPEAWSPDHLIYCEFLPAGSFFDYHDSDTQSLNVSTNKQTEKQHQMRLIYVTGGMSALLPLV